MSAQFSIEEVTVQLFAAAKAELGFEVTLETYSRITPGQASKLMQMLDARPEARQFAHYSGNGLGETRIWLAERSNGVDLSLDEVTRRAAALPATPIENRSETMATDEQTADDAALDFLSMASGIPASWKTLTPAQARLTMDQLTARADFREAALQRGNAVSEAWVWLNHKAAGKDIPMEEVRRMAAGLGPSSPATKDDSAQPDPTDEQLAAYSRAATEALNVEPVARPGVSMTAAEAKLQLSAKMSDSAWASKALTRGTPEAMENIRLNAASHGVAMSETDVGRAANGFGPEAAVAAS